MHNELLGDRYRIMDRLGEGGMAVVYVALDEKLGRQVAIKVLHQQFADNQDIRQRFELEATAISGMDHPNILKVYDYSGPESEQLWIVAEYLRGKNLSTFLTQFSGDVLHPILASCIVLEVCKALDHAHSHQMIHRDIKPENIMVLDNGRIKLMDFGIAKNLHAHTSVTQTGTFMGSPSYMSPEQIRGTQIGHVSDIYSLGVLFYEIVTGRLPYQGNNTHDVILKIMEGRFTQPSQLIGDLPGELNKIICKSMERDIARRYQTARELGRELAIVLTRYDFMESHVELERFFLDRVSFEARLKGVRKNRKIELGSNSGADQNNRTTRKIHRKKRPQGENQLSSTVTDLSSTDKTVHIQKHNDLAIAHPQDLKRFAEAEKVAGQREHLSNLKRRDHNLPKRGLSSAAERGANSRSGSPYVEVAVGRGRSETPKMKKRIVPQFPKRATSKKSFTHAPHAIDRFQRFTMYVLSLLILTGVMLALGMNLNRIKNRLEDYQNRVITNPAPLKTEAQKSEKRPEQKPISEEKFAAPIVKKQVPKNIKITKPVTIPDPVRTKKRNLASKLGRGNETSKKSIKDITVPKTEKPRVNKQVSPQISKSLQPAYVKIAANVSANIKLNGKAMGTTVDETFNSGWKKIPSGKQVITISRPGYIPVTEVVNTTPGQRLKLSNVQLQKNVKEEGRVFVSFLSKKTPVRIKITDLKTQRKRQKLMRKQRQKIGLPEGEYRLTVIHQDQEIVKFIRVIGGTPVTVKLDFE